MNITKKTIIYFYDKKSKTIEKLCYDTRNVKIIKINSFNKEMINKFNIKTFPTMIYYDPETNEIDIHIEKKDICKAIRRFKILSRYISLLPSELKNMKHSKPYIIVPYRSNKFQDREMHLKLFTENMNKQHPDWNILIIEQSDDGKKFARGPLLNIGYQFVEKMGGTYGIAHDVDIIPKEPVYEFYEVYPTYPIHIASLWTKYTHRTFFGGIVSMSIHDIKLSNGYPNHTFGWGQEDSIIRDRIIAKNLYIFKPKGLEKVFIDLEHPLTQDIPELMNERQYEDLKIEDIKYGYNSVQYKIILEQNMYPNIKKITVELEDNSIDKQQKYLETISSDTNSSSDINISSSMSSTISDTLSKSSHASINENEEKDKKIEMEILYSYEDALEIATKCLNNMEKKEIPYNLEKVENIVKDEMHGPWKIDLQSIKNTLTYVYEKLHHSCYLLCITHGKPVMYKLVNNTTPPSYKTYLENKLVDKRNLYKIKNTQWRIMQCIIKPVKKEEGFTFEYPKFLNSLKNLPDGVFLMNLTDAVILRKDGKDPWFTITGDKMLEDKYNFDSHIPILSSCGATSYWDIPIPNYDDIRFIFGYDKFGDFELNWDKKINKAVFRGGATGCGLFPDTNMRLKIGTIKSDKLDAGVTYARSNSFKFDPKHGLGYLNSNVKPVSFMKFEDQSKYKYIINIDGNVGAYRLLKSMLTKSVILKVGGMYKLWCEYVMEPYVHYVPVKDDLSDLLEIIDWCISNDDKCKDIVENAFILVKEILNKEFISSSFVKLLWQVVDKK